MKIPSRIPVILFATAALAGCASLSTREAATQPSSQIDEASPGHARQVAKAPAASAKTASVPTPLGGGYLEGDGPGPDAPAPADMDAIPDAVPHDEPLNRYANHPYIALGHTYVPLTKPGNYKERGIASWYGRKFHGQHTSSGEVYDMYAMSAAHPLLPVPSYARVTNLSNHKSVIVRINDRGPFLHDRIIDLSYTAAYKLGLTGNGSGEVEVESIAADAAATPVAADAAATPVAANAAVTPVAANAAVTPVAANAVETTSLPPEKDASAATTQAATAPAAAASAAPAAPAGKFYLQLGAFKSRQGAESFLTKMRGEFEGSGKDLVLILKDDFTRVHLGPYASADEAKAQAQKLQAQLGFKPLVSEH